MTTTELYTFLELSEDAQRYAITAEQTRRKHVSDKELPNYTAIMDSFHELLRLTGVTIMREHIGRHLNCSHISTSFPSAAYTDRNLTIEERETFVKEHLISKFKYDQATDFLRGVYVTPLTGQNWDYILLETLMDYISQTENLQEAFESLAGDVQRLLQEDADSWASEDCVYEDLVDASRTR